MIKKIFLLLLCFNLIGCGGIFVRGGLKFKRSVKTYSGVFLNSDGLKLNETYISFYRPMGECGFGIGLFGIILPIIPIWLSTNTCNKELVINSSSKKIQNLQLRYNNKVYDAFDTKSSYGDQGLFRSYGYNKTYKFKIDSFVKLRFANDKALIVTLEDGFTQELPIKWGVMMYNSFSSPL